MRINLFLIIFSLLPLAGCMIDTVPPAEIYTVSALLESGKREVGKSFKKRHQQVIKIAPVRALAPFYSNAILYTDSPYMLDSYAYSRWNDAPVKLLRLLFQEVVESNEIFAAVISPSSVSKSDYLLESTLLDFSHHVHENGSSEGVVRIRFYLIDYSTSKVKASEEFSARVTSVTQDSKGAVEALNKAADKIADELVNWLASQRYV